MGLTDRFFDLEDVEEEAEVEMRVGGCMGGGGGGGGGKRKRRWRSSQRNNASERNLSLLVTLSLVRS